MDDDVWTYGNRRVGIRIDKNLKKNLIFKRLDDFTQQLREKKQSGMVSVGEIVVPCVLRQHKRNQDLEEYWFKSCEVFLKNRGLLCEV